MPSEIGLNKKPIESFFGHMKDDIDYKDCRSFEELKELIDGYMNYYTIPN
ncbi:IS3 family transposase [Patescibacteria group bacterium]|nr:IS3 family transposase [Patescibacteria group bacterium]